MPSAVLINCFEVATEDEDEFLGLWNQADELLRSRNAYRVTRLHKALAPDARFRFINVAELPSVETWQAAVQTREFGEIGAKMARFNPTPALYAEDVTHESG